MKYQKTLVAFVTGLVAGSLLFHQFGFDNNHGQIHGWQWYQAAVLLAAIGLSAVFAEARQSVAAALGLGLAPTLVFCFEVVYLHPAESMWPVVLPVVFFLSFPAPLVGSAISPLLIRSVPPRAVRLVTLAGALIIALFLPRWTNPRNQRLETKIVPRLLQQIYKAEMIYSAQQPEGNFVCDGTLLPGSAGKFDWKAADNASLKKYLRIDYYNINLDCPNGAKPRSFRVNAISNEGYILAPHISIDETGQLRVESEGADRSPSVR